MALPGIDVSGFQGNPTWNQISGYSFAFAKTSEGVGFVDASWAWNAAGLATANLVPGAYHFARPDLGNTPEAEADFFWNTFRAQVANPTGWLLALDLEVGSGPLGDWRNRFCAELTRLSGGYVPGWYSFWNFVFTHALNSPTNYWSWFAWPDENGQLPNTNFQVSFQQYGLTQVQTVTGDVDVNRFFGDANALKSLTIQQGQGGGFLMALTDQQQADMYAWVQNLYLEFGVGPNGVTPGGVADLMLSRTLATQTLLLSQDGKNAGMDTVLSLILAGIKVLEAGGIPPASLGPVLAALAQLQTDISAIRAKTDKDLA